MSNVRLQGGQKCYERHARKSALDVRMLLTPHAVGSAGAECAGASAPCGGLSLGAPSNCLHKPATAMAPLPAVQAAVATKPAAIIPACLKVRHTAVHVCRDWRCCQHQAAACVRAIACMRLFGCTEAGTEALMPDYAT